MPHRTCEGGRVAAGFSATFRSLRNRNYRLFFFGQLISQCGYWMLTIALGWLVLHLSHDSALAVGLAVGLLQLPVLVLGAWSGLLADRVEKRRLMIVSHLVIAFLSGVLAALTIADVVELWMVYVLVTLIGCATAVEQPARHAFVNDMVGPVDLANAIGLNSALNNIARVVGPAIGGIVIVTVGIGACLMVRSVAIMAMVVALLLIRPSELHSHAPIARAKGQIREGLRYAWREPDLHSNLVLMAIIGLFASNPFPIVLPVLAKLTFHGNAGTYSVMTIAMGAGAIIGALVSAARARPTRRWVLTSVTVLGATLCLAGAAPTLSILLLILFVLGVGQMAYFTSSNTLIQLTASPEMRGRVLSLRAMLLVGIAPIGAPILGWIIDQFGGRWALVLAGASALLGAAYYARFARVGWRPERARPAIAVLESARPDATGGEPAIL